MAQYIGVPIVGTSGTFSETAADLIPEIERRVIVQDRDSAPIVTFFSQIGQVEQVQNPTYQWMEDQFDYPNAITSTDIPITGAGTPIASIVIDMADVLVGQVFTHQQSNQTFVVQAITASTPGVSATVTILQVPTSAATTLISQPATLISNGNFIVEGGYYPPSRGSRPVFKNNNVQLCSRSIAITRTLQGVATYHGNQWDYDKQKNIAQFKGDMERVVLFGKNFTETSFAQNNVSGYGSYTGTLRGSAGIWGNITTNTATYAGTLSEATWDSFLGTQVWGRRNSGSRVKIGLAGPKVLQDINTFAKNRYRILEQGQIKYGLDVRVYDLFGSRQIYLMEEREFWESTTNLNTACMVIDPAYIKLKHLHGTLMQVLDTTPPQQDLVSMALRTEFGVQMQYEQSHAKLTH